MPTLDMSINDLKLVAGLLNAERAQNKFESAIKKTASAAKAWEEENKRNAAAELRRRTEMIRMREADEAAQKRAHQERHQMYVQLFADQDKQRRNIQQIIASERAYVAALRETATAAQRAFAAGKGGLSGPMPQRDSWAAGMSRMGPQLSVFSDRDAARAKADAARAASQAAAQSQMEGMRSDKLRMAMMPFHGAPDFADRIKKEKAIRKDIAEQSKIVDAEVVNASGGIRGLGRELMAMTGATAIASQAVSNFKEMMRFASQQREQGASSLKSDFDVYREISEVSGPGEAAGRANKYKQLRAMGLDTGTAWGLLEKGIATGNEGSVDRFARTQGAMDPAVAMRVGSHLETLFKGEVNEVEGANMALEASRRSRWTVAQFAPSLPTAASGGSIGGSSAAGTLAIQSVMSDVFSSPEQASDYLRYAGVRGGRMDGLKSKGKGVMAMMEELGGMPMDDRRRAEFAGERVEFNTFIDKVNENKDRIRQRTLEIEEAQRRAMGRNSNLEVGQREFLTIQGGPELLKNRAALQQEEGTYRDEFGVQQLNVETTRANMRRRGVKRGEPIPTRWLEDKTAGAMQEAGFGAKSIELGAPASTDSFIQSALGPFGGTLYKIYETLTSIDSKTVPASKPSPSYTGGGKK